MSGSADLSGRQAVVWGLGSFGGGVAAVRHLVARGARVRVVDRQDAETLGASLAALVGLPVELVLGREHRREDLLEADLVVKNPAIPPTSPWLAELAAAGVPVTSEVALGLERIEQPYAAVTGSKGKSTSASLAGAMLAGAAAVEVAGNNERPLLDVLAQVERDGRSLDALVLELSSFMAEGIAAARRGGAPVPRPRVVAFTSLSPEHLNWHGGVEDYYGAKLGLLDLQPEVVVLPAADEELRARVPAWLVRSGGTPRLVWTALSRTELAGRRGVCLEDGWALEVGASPSEGGGAEEDVRLFAREELALLGAHNLGNALVAAAVARALGAPAAAVAEGARSFRALPHRLEPVATSPQGVRFVNDSTATTPEAAIAALRALPAPVVLLAGGADKGADYAELGRAAALAHAVVCLGVTGERVAGAVEAAVAAGAGAAEVVRAASFEEAFAAALARCPAGGTVLLAPAAASYDMFRNFKERGERFRELAQLASTPSR